MKRHLLFALGCAVIGFFGSLSTGAAMETAANTMLLTWLFGLILSVYLARFRG